MSVKATYRYLAAGAILTSLLLGACGGGDDLPNDVMGTFESGLTSSTVTSSSDAEIAAAIPKILLGIEEIKQEIKGLQSAGISPIKTSSSTRTTTTKKPSTKTRAKPSSSKPSPAKPDVDSSPAEAPASATEELQKMLDMISSKPYVQAAVEKTEKHLTQGRVTSVKLNMYAKSPNLIKIDVQYSSTGATGAKVIYTSGEGAKAKVRPGGAMSFVTTELPKTDDRLTSTNSYKFDDLDLFGVVRRLRSGYTAEIVGKTTLNGSELHILKVKTTGTNSMDPRIDFEYLGFEPDTHKLRLWECYTADSKEPFMRMALTKLEFPASLPDSTFKL
ncbi:MAG: hypothetical protein CVV27_08680 [Candidatus Melainabacteria bacterium HGW-Melainabacteria-1]|nr:MAG: hypothetical protein CVV27_08680 [Candidatus Melainabacteria bacterium HGW-Melainabacteria-1]